MTIAGVAGIVLRFGSSLVMTRMLVPEAFGILGLAVVLHVVIHMLSDIGLKQYIVAKEHGSQPEVLGVILTLSVIRGAVIAFFTSAVAIGIWWLGKSGVFAASSVYAQPEVPGVLALIGGTAIISGFRSPNMLVLDRNFDFRKISLIEFFTQVTITLASIVFAYYWRNVWSMAWGYVLGCVATVIMSIVWVKGAPYKFVWDRAIARDVIQFGRWILLSSLAFVLAQNADRLLLGNWITAAEMGMYMLALNLLLSLDGFLSGPFVSVALPTFSEVARRRDGSMRSVYFKVRLPLDLVSIAIAGMLYATGQFVVDMLYDPRYQAAGHTLQILSFSVLFTRYMVAVQAHNALMEPRVGSWVNIAKLVSIVVMIPIGYELGGSDGVLWAIALHMLPPTLLTWWHNRRHDLFDPKFEAKVLLAWPVGYAAGLAGMWVLHALFAEPIARLMQT